MKSLLPFVLVGIGGALGSMTRYGVGLFATQRFGARFPVGTFIVNVVGCFLIAFIMTLVAKKMLPYSNEIRLALAVGFLGGLTTYSSFTFETDTLARNGEWVLTAVNLFGSLAAGFLAVRVGTIAARLL